MKLILLLLLNMIFITLAWAHDINPRCYNYLTELVRSSNFPFKNIPKEHNYLLIDTDENEIILAQVNYSKDKMGIFYDTNETAMNGWIKYDINSQKLYNVSAEIDPDESAPLFFNTTYAILFEQCRTRLIDKTD